MCVFLEHVPRSRGTRSPPVPHAPSGRLEPETCSALLKSFWFCLIPQTVACKLWVLALNLYIRFWVADFAPRRPIRSCHKSLQIFKFSKYAIQHVAVAPAKVLKTKYVLCLSTCLIWKCCCGSRQDQNVAVRQLCPIIGTTYIIISKHKGNTSNLDFTCFVYEGWNCFVVKFLGNFMIVCVPNFVGVYLEFMFNRFLMEILTCWGPPIYRCSSEFHIFVFHKQTHTHTSGSIIF